MRWWTTKVRVLSATPTSAVASARRWRAGLKRIGGAPKSNGAPAPFQSHRTRSQSDDSPRARSRSLRARSARPSEASGESGPRRAVPAGGEGRSPSLELKRQTEARLGASRVQTRQAPGLEDRRAVPARRHEVALGEVHDEVVADHVVDRPERLHVELVGRVDRDAGHRHDAAAAVEGEGREGEERLPVADLVAEGR